MGGIFSVFLLMAFGQILKAVIKCDEEQNCVQIQQCRLKNL